MFRPLVYLVEEHKFLLLENMLTCLLCFIEFNLGAKPLHDVYQ
jgi:hypothetical protein